MSCGSSSGLVDVYFLECFFMRGSCLLSDVHSMSVSREIEKKREI